MLKILGLLLGIIIFIHGLLVLKGKQLKSLRFLLLTSTLSLKEMKKNVKYSNWVGKVLIFQGLCLIFSFLLFIVGINEYIIFAIILPSLILYFFLFFLGQKKYLKF